MRDKFGRIAVTALILLLAAMVAQPYVDRYLFSATEPRPVTARGTLSDVEKSTVALFEAVAPSVVQVIVRAPTFGAANADVASGSGFVWDAAGHIVTNNHVVRDAPSLVVRFASGEIVPADVVGRAPNYDLAVLRLRQMPRLPPPLPIGSSADLKVGQSTFAIGNPFGLDQTLTTGVISALNRHLATDMPQQREIADVIQTDTAINPGNSGGPLLDSSGRLIGVNTAIFSPSGTNSGIGFAVPVDTVNRVVPALIKDGRVPTPGIGILSANENLVGRLGLEGVMIADTMPGSPAERAGLAGLDPRTGRIGDLIVEANGKAVRQLSDLTDQLERVGVGKPIPLKIARGGDRFDVTIPVIDIGER
jgi:2-alkenal reductase